ncbi:hypothetical protein [Peredibacter starrii]|uniref:Uncharacterized protein n=1 Tax=Peredibacter starrii TaxID=28202 RepID=A0AAX4HSG4_9BACT|nr:hypothetical protein [Peredibacter starrii]WPU65986.1 hypothetical protein SOO65_04440 [Peredibacter starrii]
MFGLSGAAANYAKTFGTQVVLGALGGAAGGYISAHVSAQINEGNWRKASSQDIMFSMFGGALGGMIAGPYFANTPGGIAAGTMETASSSVGGATSSPPRGYYNDAGTWTSP